MNKKTTKSIDELKAEIRKVKKQEARKKNSGKSRRITDPDEVRMMEKRFAEVQRRSGRVYGRNVDDGEDPSNIEIR